MSVGRKPSYDIAVLPGDGIGPEIMDVAVNVLKAASSRFDVTFNFTEAHFGGAAIDESGVPLPEDTLAVCKASDSILLACIGGEKWNNQPRELRPESGLLGLRKSLGLFANLRPAVVLPQLVDASPLKADLVRGIDVMIVRELTGDVYFGEPRGIETDPTTGKRVGYNNMIYHEHEVERVAKVAFELARKRNFRVTSVDKENVLFVSQLWRDVVMRVAKDYEDVELLHLYVDNAAMQLVRWPRQFDVMVTGNIFGDILSDLASMLTGSLGMLPSASLGDASGPGVFEPVHGSAPDIALQNKANPCAMVLSAAMMLRYDLDRPEIADAVERAVVEVLDTGLRTGDIASDGTSAVGCKEFGEALVEKMSATSLAK